MDKIFNHYRDQIFIKDYTKRPVPYFVVGLFVNIACWEFDSRPFGFLYLCVSIL